MTIGKKVTLGALVIALSSVGCKNINPSVPVNQTNTINDKTVQDSPSAGFDSIDDHVNIDKFPNLLDSTYFIINEAQYENPDGEIETFHSLGSAVLHSDVRDRTYLVTANHVVDNEDEIFNFFMGKYTKKSERSYLLDDHQVRTIQRILRALTMRDAEDTLYFKNRHDTFQKLDHVIKTSEELKVILSVIKPREVRVDAGSEFEEKDTAIISVKDLPHKPIEYEIGNSDKIKVQNLVFVTGYPLGMLKNLNRGFITHKNDSYLTTEDPQSRFIFDASISPGNSGGGIFVSQNGKFKLIGLTSASYRRGNDLYIGVKINAVSDVFKGDSIICSKGWKCNKALPYEIKL